MQYLNLYRYYRPDGGVTVSTEIPECEYTSLYRIVADEGELITNGNILVSSIDTESIDSWYSVPCEISDSEALKIITGVTQ